MNLITAAANRIAEMAIPEVTEDLEPPCPCEVGYAEDCDQHCSECGLDDEPLTEVGDDLHLCGDCCREYTAAALYDSYVAAGLLI